MNYIKFFSVKPSEEIDRLYTTTAIATTSTKKTITMKMNVTAMSHSTSLKINESKVDLIIETTPMNERNVMMNNTTTSIFTQSSPVSNITHFLPLPTTTPTTLSTFSPINITVQISSTLTPYEVLKFNNMSTNSNSSSVTNSSTSLMFKHFTIVPNKTSVVNILTTTTNKIVDKPIETPKFVLTNTNVTPKQILINVSSSTAKPDVTNITMYSAKSINTSDTIVEYFIITNKTNVTTSTLFTTSSTVQPITMNTNILFTKINAVNFSSTTQKTLMKPNASINFEPLNTTFSTKSINVQKITHNDLNTENKSTTFDNIPSRVEYFNKSSVSNHKMVVADPLHPSSNLIPTKYGTTLKDENTIFNQNNLSSENIESTNHSETKSYKSINKVKPTKVKISNEKPELYNFLHSQTTTENGSKLMIEAEYKKQNGEYKYHTSSFGQICIIPCYIFTVHFKTVCYLCLQITQNSLDCL